MSTSCVRINNDHETPRKRARQGNEHSPNSSVTRPATCCYSSATRSAGCCYSSATRSAGCRYSSATRSAEVPLLVRYSSSAVLLLVRYSSGGRAATRPLPVRRVAATRPLLVRRGCCYSSATRPRGVLVSWCGARARTCSSPWVLVGAMCSCHGVVLVLVRALAPGCSSGPCARVIVRCSCPVRARG